MVQNIGVDGCKGGWVACWHAGNFLDFEVFETFQLLVETFDGDAIIAVDMPIGLPERVGAGGRGPESLIRPMLGARKSSVFSIPSRPAVYAQTYDEACQIAFDTSTPQRKISKQGFFLFPKIREIDRLLRADENARTRIFETHPELVFRTIKLSSLEFQKKTIEGAEERKQLLKNYGLAVADWPKIKGATLDDIIDSAACLVTATRIASHQAQSFPNPPKHDSYGIPIAIWA